MGVSERSASGQKILPEDNWVGRQRKGGFQVQGICWGGENLGSSQEQWEYDVWKIVTCFEVNKNNFLVKI